MAPLIDIHKILAPNRPADYPFQGPSRIMRAGLGPKRFGVRERNAPPQTQPVSVPPEFSTVTPARPYVFSSWPGKSPAQERTKLTFHE